MPCHHMSWRHYVVPILLGSWVPRSYVVDGYVQLFPSWLVHWWHCIAGQDVHLRNGELVDVDGHVVCVEGGHVGSVSDV